MVSRQIIRCIGVHTLCTDEVEHVAEILGRGDLCLAHGALVDLRSQLLAYLRVGSLAILVVKRNNRIIDWFLFLPIQCTDTLRSFEEHMLQIVSQTCVLCRFIYCSGANHYVARYIRLVVVFPQHNRQAVV